MKRIIYACARVIRVFYNPFFIEKVRRGFSLLKWYCCLPEFKAVGNNTNVGRGFRVRGAGYISLGDNFRAGEGLLLEAWDEYAGDVYTPEIIIGSNVSFTDYIHISCVRRIEIGDGTLLGQNVFIADNFHGDTARNERDIRPADRKLSCKGGIKIGRNVWIGKGVSILSGVTIGDGAVIGANAVVTKDIPAYAVAVGVPARVIKTLP